MKRIISLIITFLVFLSLIATASCGSENEQNGSSVSVESIVSYIESSSVSEEQSALQSDETTEVIHEASNDVSMDASEDSSDVSVEESRKTEESEESEESSEASEPEESTPEEPEKEIVSLFDSSSLSNYASPFLPSYAPFSLYDTGLFSGTVVTSISFPFDSLASGYSVDSPDLYMPVYVVKNDFTTKRSECTLENGKKVILDFTGKLSGVSRGDWLTVDGLNIVVGEDETLAFGDTDMAVLPMFLRNDGTYGFWNKVFETKGGNNHSLIFKIEGYRTTEDKRPENSDKKYISFMGDSISTYEGWSNGTSYNSTIGGNKVWYPNNNYNGANLTVDQTWWSLTAKGLGYEIAVNNSWSGSVVCNTQAYNVRAKNLHNTSTGATPDVVVIFMGVNDYAAGTAVGNYDGTAEPPANPTNFSEAYGRMIKNILDKYEGVEIYCCTFLPDRKRFSGSVNNNGIDESAYNNAIITIAKNMGVNVIELYKDSGINAANISQNTVDKLHPNKDGMEKIAKLVISEIK